MKKFIKSRIFYFILGALIFTGVGVYASQILSKDIMHTKKDGTEITVEQALNELYSNDSQSLIIAHINGRFGNMINESANNNYFEYNENNRTYKSTKNLKMICYITTTAYGSTNAYTDIYINGVLNKTITGKVPDGLDHMNIYEIELQKNDEIYFYVRTDANRVGQYNIAMVSCNLNN